MRERFQGTKEAVLEIDTQIVCGAAGILREYKERAEC